MINIYLLHSFFIGSFEIETQFRGESLLGEVVCLDIFVSDTITIERP